MTEEIIPRDNKYFGWRRSLPDFRDRRVLQVTTEARLPERVDLRRYCPPVMDQGELGSCCAHAVTAAIRYDRVFHGLPDMQLSRLQNYYDARRIEGTVEIDAGVELRDAIKVAARRGVGPEKLWPYDIDKFTHRPPFWEYIAALPNQAVEYRAVPQTVQGIKSVLYGGHPVIFGISAYESFDSVDTEQSGLIVMPKETERMLGGHALYLYGYGLYLDDHFDGRNSWGELWGRKGDFSIPFSYLTDRDLAGDCWTITGVG